MKLFKKIIALGIMPMLLLGCNNPEASSSSTSSDPSSSDSSGGGSLSSQAIPLLGALTEFVAYHAGKYSSSVTYSSLLEAATKADGDFDINRRPTYADTFLLSYLAFKDILPERVGSRVFEWYENPANPAFSSYSEDSIYTTAFRFFSDAGLVDSSLYGASFDALASADGSFIDKFIDHIHQWIGSSAKDDFHAYANQDVRSVDQPGVGPNDNLTHANLINQANVISYINGAIEEVPSAKNFVEAVKGIGSNNLFKEELLRYDGASSVKELYSLLIKDFAERGYSPLFQSYDRDRGGKSEEDDYCYLIVQNYDIMAGHAADYAEGGQYRESTIATYSPLFSALLDDEAKGLELAENFADYSHLYLVEVEKNEEIPEGIAFSSPDDKIGEMDITFSDMAADMGLASADYLSFMNQRVATSFYSLFKDANLDELKAYCAYMLMDHYKILLPDTPLFNGQYVRAGYSGSKFDDSSFFLNTFTIPFAGNLVAHYATTEEYAKEFEVLDNLKKSLQNTLKEKLSASSWLSEEGKGQAIKKIDNMKNIVLSTKDDGTLLDYVATEYAPLGSGENAFDYFFAWDSAVKDASLSFIGEPKEGFIYDLLSFFTPMMINAFYAPSGNCLVLLPGFLFAMGQASEMTQERLYSSYGWILAHEMGHGYDANGFRYDDGGKLNPAYIPEADRETFEGITENYAAYYSDREVLADISSDAGQILDEALADNVGMSVALDAGKKLDGFSPKEFFLQGAKNMGTYMTRATAKRYASRDSHPIGRARINPLFSCFDDFHEAYDVGPDDYMYVAPNDRIIIY